MTIDYKKVGLKSGLEIHQQLDTKKLFCNCNSILRSDSPDFIIKRKLHAVAGESGEIDVAAKYQASLDKEFNYEGYDSTCLVELDEEPPHMINSEALKIALQVAVFLNCKIIPITQIMRKTVVNGSNTSGFQRTVQIARDGYIQTSFGKVGIESLCLEEDAARIIEQTKVKDIFRLDRLGIPLIEIATSPDIKNPEQAKEAALHLGNILRSCKVKRGLGTIRQDVNVSIKGSKRVELKGFQDIKNIGVAIEKEVLRQIDLVKKNESVSEVRNVLENGDSEFIRPMPGSDRMYPETDLPLLKISRDLINQVKKTLPQLRSDIEKELKKQGLSEELIKILFKQNKIEEYKELLDSYNHPQFVAKTILIFPKDIASRENLSLEKVNSKLEDYYSDILELVNKKKIPEENVKDILFNLVNGVQFNEAIKIEKIDMGDMEEKIMNLIKEKPGLSDKAYMGLVMSKFKGKISGKGALELIHKFLD